MWILNLLICQGPRVRSSPRWHARAARSRVVDANRDRTAVVEHQVASGEEGRVFQSLGGSPVIFWSDFLAQKRPHDVFRSILSGDKFRVQCWTAHLVWLSSLVCSFCGCFWENQREDFVLDFSSGVILCSENDEFGGRVRLCRQETGSVCAGRPARGKRKAAEWRVRRREDWRPSTSTHVPSAQGACPHWQLRWRPR